MIIVEDESDIAELVSLHLAREGWTPTIHSDGTAGLEAIRAEPPALVILDLMLPGRDGFEICREMRRDAELEHVPILMLSARGEETDKVAGLELGADDYMEKPFAPRELVARAKRLVARAAPREKAGEQIVAGPITIDLERHEIHVEGELIGVTRTEFRILELLCKRPGRVRDRGEILEFVSEGSALERTVDVHIASLRRKLGETGALVETVRGVGYRINL
ncbi:response regulator transcription factor [Engelhardtia mirabilis]|uniref:response regulator transcription factor n=1 Tax=Engelhardtia mirabilis TaxID=2528011 RepID=UPI003AF36D7B